MKIAGHDFMFEQNERLRNQLQNSNVRATESISPVGNTQSLPINIDKEEKEPEKAALVDFSTSARVNGTESQTSKNFPGTNFSTSEDANIASQTASISNSVLNQYRFFVQTNQYEGQEGVVKRIFR